MSSGLEFLTPWGRALIWRALVGQWDAWRIPDDPFDLSPWLWPPLLPEPVVAPWVSPGRISLAPAPSRADQMTWDAAASGLMSARAARRARLEAMAMPVISPQYPALIAGGLA